MKIGKWSTTAANNNATPPDGFPEGQAPSTLNDCAREMMAAIKTAVNTLDYIDYDNTPSYLSATTFSLGTADATNWEIGRRVKLFDATTLYGTIISVSATFVQVRLDSGVLTSSLSSAALGVLRNTSSALPNAAYNQQNVVINGAFEFWQRTASAENVANLQYVADRFKYESNNSASVNIYRLERSANATFVPTLASAGVQLNNAMTVLVSAVDAVIANGDYAAITYTIEGNDWRRVAHGPLALSFQVNASRSGIYGVCVRSTAQSASYVQNYTISTINTWQKVFMTFPDAPTNVTWDYSAGIGLLVTWTLAAGATYQAAANSWTTMNALATSSQVNFLGTATNQWTIANVQLRGGTADIPVAQRSYNQERDACQRYYWKGLPCGALNVPAYTAGCALSWPVAFPTTMRVTPSVTSVLSGSTWSNLDSATYAFSLPTPQGVRFLAFSTIGNPNCNVIFGANDFFAADAEL